MNSRKKYLQDIQRDPIRLSFITCRCIRTRSWLPWHQGWLVNTWGGGGLWHSFLGHNITATESRISWISFPRWCLIKRCTRWKLWGDVQEAAARKKSMLFRTGCHHTCFWSSVPLTRALAHPYRRGACDSVIPPRGWHRHLGGAFPLHHHHLSPLLNLSWLKRRKKNYVWWKKMKAFKGTTDWQLCQWQPCL